MLKKRTLQLFRDIKHIKTSQISSLRCKIAGTTVSVEESAWILNTSTGKPYLFDKSQTLEIPPLVNAGMIRYDLVYSTFTGVLTRLAGLELVADDYEASMPEIPINVIEISLVRVVDAVNTMVDIRSIFNVVPQPTFEESTGTILFDLR